MKENELRVLLIDDDDDDIFFTSGYLADINSPVLHISFEKNYLRAISTVLNNQHDVCLVDYFLGPYNGVQLIKECRSAGVIKPFILISGNRDATLDAEAKAAGAYEVILKDDLNKMTAIDRHFI